MVVPTSLSSFRSPKVPSAPEKFNLTIFINYKEQVSNKKLILLSEI